MSQVKGSWVDGLDELWVVVGKDNSGWSCWSFWKFLQTSLGIFMGLQVVGSGLFDLFGVLNWLWGFEFFWLGGFRSGFGDSSQMFSASLLDFDGVFDLFRCLGVVNWSDVCVNWSSWQVGCSNAEAQSIRNVLNSLQL